MAIDTQRARKERESEQDVPNGHARKEHLLVLHLQVGTLFGGACIPPSLLWASVDPPDSRPQRRRPPCRHLFIGGSCFLVLCPGRTCCPGPKICSSGPCHGGWLRRPSAPGCPAFDHKCPLARSLGRVRTMVVTTCGTAVIWALGKRVVGDAGRDRAARHSITSSARSIIDGGMARPSAFSIAAFASSRLSATFLVLN